jgi:formimidoylglutamate deiminase
VVLDDQAPGLAGLPSEHTLDGLVFATDAPAVRDVYVAGRHVVADGRHVHHGEIAPRFARAMSQLWGP